MLAPRENTGKIKKSAARRISYARLAVWAGIGVAVAVVAYWLSSSPMVAQEQAKERKTSPIAVVDYDKASPAQGGKAAKEKIEKPLPPQKPHEVRNGMLMLSNGKLIPANKIRKVSVEDRKPRFKYAIFEHSTDNELAAIITLKPGEALIGGPIRRADYKAEFMKSIETPIIIHNDDPEDVQEVKQAVINARMVIKDAIDRGEDPADVIREAYEEAQKLALYKDDIQKQVMNMAKEGDYTEEEVDDLIASANIMLEAKGIEPIALGPIMKARLRTLKR